MPSETKKEKRDKSCENEFNVKDKRWNSIKKKKSMQAWALLTRRSVHCVTEELETRLLASQDASSDWSTMETYS